MITCVRRPCRVALMLLCVMLLALLAGSASARGRLEVRYEWAKGPSSGLLGIGATIHAYWSLPGGRDAPTRGRYDFVVLTMPDTVRLKGDGFLAVPPGARMPFGMELQPERLRVLFPLYLVKEPNHGKLTIRPLSSGALRVEATYLVVDGRGRDAGTASPSQSLDLRVIDSRPRLMVEDLEQLPPAKAVGVSADGGFELRILDEAFEVRDAATGRRLLGGPGRGANFSPTGRFLSYEEASGAMEIVDLLDLKVAVTARTNDTAISVLVWAQNDAYALLGTYDMGGVVVLQPRIEGRVSRAFGHGCRICEAWETTKLKLFPEAALILVGEVDLEETPGALFPGHRLVEADGFSPEEMRWEAQLSELGLAVPVRARRRWDTGDRLRIGYVGAHGPDEKARPYARYVYGPTPLKAAARGHAGPVSVRRRGVLPLREAVAKTPPNRLAARLEALGLPLRPSRSLAALHRTGSAVVRETAAKDDLHSRLARRYLIDSVWEGEEPPPGAVDPDAELCGYDGFVHYWRWRKGDTEQAVALTGCTNGVHEGFDAAWLYRNDGKESRLTDLDALARAFWTAKGVGSRFSFLGTEGVRNPVSLFWPSSDEVLLCDADSGAVLDLDLARHLVRGAAFGLPEPHAIAALRLTTDGRHVVQVNRTGKLFVYDLSTGRKVLNGLYLDDELVVFDDRGYYDATPQGASFVHWFFPGSRQYHALNQFRATFYVDGLLARTLRGASPDVPVAILQPPRARLTLVGEKPGAGTVEIRADVRGPKGLTAAVLLVDGVPVHERSLSGTSASFSQRLSLRRGAHSVQLVATDTAGHESVPVLLKVAAPRSPRRPPRLRALTVGINRYAGLRGQDLRFARRDAEAVSRLFEEHAGRRFSEVTVETFTDSAASPSKILSEVRRLAKGLESDDLLVLFFAGHGRKGGDGGFRFLTGASLDRRDSPHDLVWDDLAKVLAASSARALVLVDACHSGAAALRGVDGHESSVRGLLGAGRVGIAVLAASKGRQMSLESVAYGGGHGAFAHALIRALGSERTKTDSDLDGSVDLGELYQALRIRVRELTDGRQTPWLGRHGAEGVMPIL